MKIINKKYLFATVVCVTLTSPVFAAIKYTSAFNESEAASVTVSVADLNLDRAEGMETLHSRLKSAAKRVCYMHDGTLSLPARIQRQKCFDETMERVTYRIGLKNAVGVASQ